MLTCKGRIFVLKIGFFLIFLTIIVRIFSIQILDVFNLFERYNKRYLNQKIIIPADRGIIYDYNGNVLAENKKYFKLDLRPAIIGWTDKDSVSVEQKQQIYQKIAEIVAKHSKKSEKHYIKKIRKNAETYPNGFELATKLDAITKEEILSDLKKEKITGISDYKQMIDRIYPKADLAAPLIGFSAQNEVSCGIEGTFDKKFTGIDGWEEVIQYGNRKLHHFSDMNTQHPISGSSIYLTIDTHIQAILEKNLKDGIEDYQAKNAIGVIISPKNGNILAMAGISAENMNASNRVLHTMPIFPISWLYEPGSTMKSFIALLAIEKNLFKPIDIIDCKTRKIGRRTIRDVKEYYKLTFRDVIVFSSNVGMTRVADELGKKNLYDQLTDFGFGHKTGITLNGESSGVLRHYSDWSKLSLHSLSFGQEISVTPIQLAFAYGALANNGYILQPQIIKEIRDSEGKKVFKSKRKVVRRISNKKSLDTLKTFLLDVVEYGTGKNAKLKYVNIAAKTGTAEKHKENGVGYSKKDDFVSSIAGFFPAEDPEIVMLIIFDEPDYDHRYGSTSAAPTFKKITEEIIVHPNSNLISIINEINQKRILVPNCIGLTTDKLEEFLLGKHISYSILGEGNIITDQFPKPGTTMSETFTIQFIADVKEENNSY